MSDDPSSEPAGSQIRFDRAEFEPTSSTSRCALCSEPLAGSYFEINGAMVCPHCRAKVDVTRNQGSGLGRGLRALAAGFGAAVLGAGIYYAVLALTRLEIGLIAIVVGFLVGGAVRWGSAARGGWLYQTMAIVLTYLAIVSTYVPFVIKGAEANAAEQAAASGAGPVPAAPGAATASTQKAGEAATRKDVAATATAVTPSLGEFVIAVATMAGLILAIPFLAGIQNFIGWLIIGFALYQAWKMNRRQQLAIAGPFRLAPAAGAAPPPPAQGEASAPPPPALEPA
jgi:hypothetical protein